MREHWYSGQPETGRRVAFKLASGRVVEVLKFQCSYTYEGLLFGRPNPRLNEMILAPITRLRTSPGELVLTPEARPGEHGGVYLPPMVCRAELRSSSLSPRMDHSMLNVTWFAPSFLDRPLGEFIAASLAGISWDNASDYQE